jgi:uncharacterized protein YhbP (UPF0306 family)
MATTLPTAITDLLELTTLSLATTGPEGEPHAAALYYAELFADGKLRLYFFSEPGSQHALDTARDARAAGAVQVEYQGWQEIRGLQLRGQVRQVPEGPEWDQAWEAYIAKFPFVSGLKAVVTLNKLYVFEPTWVRLVGNRSGFGSKEEWALQPEGWMPVPRPARGADQP